jgi:hypothetical protein
MSQFAEEALGSHNTQEMEMALHEWLQMQEPNFHCNRIFKLVPRWNKCMQVHEDYV